MRILLTGAAGFIGRHVGEKIVGHELICHDSYEPQVHGTHFTDGEKIETSYRKRFRMGDCPMEFRSDVVIHLAALVGVGQSMYEPARYIECNVLDTARFLENLTKNKPKRLVVASSMSVYGEGEYVCEHTRERLDPCFRGSRIKGGFEWQNAMPVGTSEQKPPQITSVYALTKYNQEQLCLMWGEANGVEVVALRFFNVYGPGQSLNNPYTGCLAIFANRLLNGKAPIIFEDGKQTRDFIHVSDISSAVVHAALGNVPRGIFNVGTGVARTIESVALDLAAALGSDIKPEITHKTRVGDIRHCYADNSKLCATGWAPAKDWHEGLREYVQWLKTQPRPEDRTEKAIAELEEKGLLR